MCECTSVYVSVGEAKAVSMYLCIYVSSKRCMYPGAIINYVSAVVLNVAVHTNVLIYKQNN